MVLDIGGEWDSSNWTQKKFDTLESKPYAQIQEGEPSFILSFLVVSICLREGIRTERISYWTGLPRGESLKSPQNGNFFSLSGNTGPHLPNEENEMQLASTLAFWYWDPYFSFSCIRSAKAHPLRLQYEIEKGLSYYMR